MNILLLSPGYPGEMPSFTRGLADVGANVYGVGDQHPGALPPSVRERLAGYLQVRSLWDEAAVVEAVRRWPEARRIDKVECLWEPGMLLAARLREGLGVDGLGVAQTLPFRDKEQMKQVLDAAGLRTPKHVRCNTTAECWDAAEQIGFPIIIKPIAGAGSADTYRVESADELRAVLPRLGHVPEVSVEEFVDGSEFTFDTVCIEGKVAYFNIAWYRPRPLVARSNEWISPQVIALRNVDQPALAGGVKLGHDVIRALGFRSGFTHMEWYLKADGEVVFGEIGARPPGAHQVDQMNYACDFDVFREWGRAVAWGRFDVDIERKYNVSTIYKRAQGQGQIQRIVGLDRIRKLYGEHIVWDNLLPVGAQRRNWRNTLVSDGFLMLRHPELQTLVAISDDIGENLQLYAG
ncbi:ATP-grasp domain-containing protein [Nannocystis punicea]|uniref:ATP-grasp domain-containing protein n=1 Tax=Nannocystis punicea TaxID=2995304 RepID=A0ABY7HJ13_9BACT|nr:ATP-grasp domain-containing protein [Nannocystis poenicansa]WAS99025.1 ATP-grasp domain-containing protein [Nannocystis poenicansa]